MTSEDGLPTVTRTDTYVDILGGAVRVTRSDILDRAHFTASDIVLVSGSLVEGIGNIHSDLDCLVICLTRPTMADLARDAHALVSNEDYKPELGEGEVHNTYDYFGDAGLHIDFDYITFAEVESLIERVAALGVELSEDQRILYEPALSAKESRLFHRLIVGHAFHGGEEFERLRQRLPTRAFCYVAFREFLPNYYVFKDVQGAWLAGDLWMAREIARNMMIDHTQAYLNLNGETNKNRKWLFKTTCKLSAQHPLLPDRFRELMGSGASSDEDCRRATMAMLAFMDELHAATPAALQRSQFSGAATALSGLTREFAARGQVDHVLAREEAEYRRKSFDPVRCRSLQAMVLEWESDPPSEATG